MTLLYFAAPSTWETNTGTVGFVFWAQVDGIEAPGACYDRVEGFAYYSQNVAFLGDNVDTPWEGTALSRNRGDVGRIGIRLENGDTVFAPARNFVLVEDEDAPEWALGDIVKRNAAQAQADSVAVGDWVEGAVSGKVFWKKGARLGVATSSAKKGRGWKDVAWTFADKVRADNDNAPEWAK